MSSSRNSASFDVRGHFERQAAGWELRLKPKGSMAGRPQQFVGLLREFAPRSGHILDFGCGTGEITLACKTAGFNARGADCARGMIERARVRFTSMNLEFDLLPEASPTVLPYEDATFDGVVASSVLEYVMEPAEVLRELRRVCRPGGVLIMSVPDMRHPRRWIEEAARPILKLIDGGGLGRLSLYCDYVRISRNRSSARKWKETLESTGWAPPLLRRTGSSLMVLVATAH